MNRIFGNKKPAAPPINAQQAIHDALGRNDERVQGLTNKIRTLDEELNRYRAQLSKLREGPSKESVKQRAMHILKQKRQFESQRDTLMQQSFNMEQANIQVESLKSTIEQASLMKETKKSLQGQLKKFDATEVDRLQDDLEDMYQDVSYMQETMSRSYGVPDTIDDAELEAELAMLDNDLVLDTTEGVPDASYLDFLPSSNNSAPPDPSIPLVDPPVAPPKAAPPAPFTSRYSDQVSRST